MNNLIIINESIEYIKQLINDFHDIPCCEELVNYCYKCISKYENLHIEKLIDFKIQKYNKDHLKCVYEELLKGPMSDSDYRAYVNSFYDMGLEFFRNIPSYLYEIDPKRREEIVNASAKMTSDIPTSVICGGNATRLLYEVYTGNIMYGVGKNDSDIYVDKNKMLDFLKKQPKGYSLKHELDKNGNEKWIQPQNNYIVLTRDGENIDVFGVDASHKSVLIQIDGKLIRVQSLVDQINDKLKMLYHTKGLKTIEIDKVHNPDPMSKYGVYAQKLLEMCDTELGKKEIEQGSADFVTPQWKILLEVMASLGKYGKEVDSEKVKIFKKMLNLL